MFLRTVAMGLKAALAAMVALLVALSLATPAQATKTSADKAVSHVVRSEPTTSAPKADSGNHAAAVYFCNPPFRYSNGAQWNCTVNSGAIQFWIECSIGGTYYSNPHGRGSYFVSVFCPQGRRLNEGVREVA